MVQRSDNRVLLYDYENDDQMVKLKDFEMFSKGQISFDTKNTQVFIPCFENLTGVVKVFDQLEAPQGLISNKMSGQKVKNNNHNQF